MQPAIFVLDNPVLEPKNQRHIDEMTVSLNLDIHDVYDLLLDGICSQISLGDPYLVEFDTYSHYQQELIDMLDESEDDTDLNEAASHLFEMHSRFIEKFVKKYPKHVKNFTDHSWNYNHYTSLDQTAVYIVLTVSELDE